MKKVFIMDENGMHEYVLKTLQENSSLQNNPEEESNSISGSSYLTIADLLEKFPITRPTIYSWEKKGLLKRIPIGGRVFFDPNDIKTLIEKKKAI